MNSITNKTFLQTTSGENSPRFLSGAWSFALAIALIAGSVLFSSCNSGTAKPLKTERLCVLFDAGETTVLLPILEKWDAEGKDFRVLVMGTAETKVQPTKFGKKRVTLRDLGILDQIDQKTERTKSLGIEALNKLEAFKPKMVLVGTASRIQQQVLEKFSDAITVAVVDNFNYDPTHESFDTVKKVQAAAKHVLCPSQNVVELFVKDSKEHSAKHHVVGKPSLEVWRKEIEATDKNAVLQKLGLNAKGGRIITFIGGYGPGYDVVNPLFDEQIAQLQKEGYQTILQPHPKMAPQKVTTQEALAVSDYVVGYNSSVILDAALIGKNAFFMIPDQAPFSHFAINNGIHKVKNIEEMVAYMKCGSKPDICDKLVIPQNSVQRISDLADSFILPQNH